MYCILIKNREVTNFSSIYELLKTGADSLFVIDYDAITRRYLNIELYEKLSDYFELTVMNFPVTDQDLIDTFINGASTVVINNNLTYKTISRFLEISENLAMLYAYNDTCRYFSELGGRMYLSDRQVMLPYKLIYNYGHNYIENSINLEFFPDEIKSMID
ncbi:hypothetical protein [Picrophilus oshimae]|uniref:Uncharacterized protein n=1 Tax=Picrophilus torridus (strain ATCC 700027 / DSM 9790 / JCM 10055 / NBRC 100828 / KAW 2/3) TaxID=1122961 RepID=Q6L2R4_PICTO|nr:hypothetical protein [Picrophilus oshimae]AAT42738.1 hypothetical protein PTO0153 [Picrophilus oshimae DSM 9789]SMD31526.1 hypothetical protein SAMN02745355_1474 [Picrophilus oshimae DSM 9789]